MSASGEGEKLYSNRPHTGKAAPSPEEYLLYRCWGCTATATTSTTAGGCEEGQ